MLVCGIDPGATTALALVEARPQGQQHRLLARDVVVPGPRDWTARLDAAVSRLRPTPSLIVVEAQHPRVRVASPTYHHAVAASLGERAGAVLGVLAVRFPGVEVWRPTTAEWTTAIGVAPGKGRRPVLGPTKMPKGWHRVSEVALRVDWPVGLLSPRFERSQPRGLRGWKWKVDLAEAGLMACAGIAFLRGREVGRRAGVTS